MIIICTLFQDNDGEITKQVSVVILSVWLRKVCVTIVAKCCIRDYFISLHLNPSS